MVSAVCFALLLLPSSFCSATKISNFGGETSIYYPPVLASNFIDGFAGSSNIQGLIVNKILEDRSSLKNATVMPYGRIAHSTSPVENRVLSPRSEIRSNQEPAKPEVRHSNAIRLSSPTISVKSYHGGLSSPTRSVKSYQGGLSSPTRSVKSYQGGLSSPTRSVKSYQGDSIQPGRALGGTLIMQLESRKGNSEPLSNALTKLISKLISMDQQNRVGYQQRTPRFERSRQGEVITPRRMYTGRGEILRTYLLTPNQANNRFDNNFKTGSRLLQDNDPRSSFVFNVNGNMDSAGRKRENRQLNTVRHTHNHSDWKGKSNQNHYQPSLQPLPIKTVSTKKTYFSDFLTTPGMGRQGNIISGLHDMHIRENRMNTVNTAIVDANKNQFLNSPTVILGSPRLEPADGPNVQRKGGSPRLEPADGPNLQRKGGSKTVSSYTGRYIEIGTPTHT